MFRGGKMSATNLWSSMIDISILEIIIGVACSLMTIVLSLGWLELIVIWTRVNL